MALAATRVCGMWRACVNACSRWPAAGAQTGSSKEDVDEIMRQADVNGDGVIDYVSACRPSTQTHSAAWLAV